MSGAPGNYSPRIVKQPPDKGSFPIDHENVCKKEMIQLLKCLQASQLTSEQCQAFSKDYLKCRMDNGLMAKEDWKQLGFDKK